MTAGRRRIGSETSKTRDLLLDCAIALVAEDGYPGVTYRRVATRAEVTPGLVQYYFPTLDEIFVAAIRRESDRNAARLSASLAARPGEELAVLWEYSRDEAATTVMLEFMALGNHRESIRREIKDAMARVRKIELAALSQHLAADPDGRAAQLGPAATMFLLAAIPKMMQLESGFGITSGHRDVRQWVDGWIDAKPRPAKTGRKRPPRAGATGASPAR